MNRLEKFRLPSLVGGLVLLAFTAPGLLRSDAGACQSYLLAFTYWTGLSIGALVLLLINHLSGGRWGIVIRRQLEASASVIPVCALLFIPVVLNLPALYLWARPDVVAVDHHIQKIAAYLNPQGFLLRAIGYFGIWTFMAMKLLRRSALQDEGRPVKSFGRIAGPGLVVLILSATFAVTDWMMSLEPHWFSTVYGAKVLTGYAVAMLSLAIVMATYLKAEDKLRDVATTPRFHDLGNLLFAATMFWTYLNFSQFILIWSANLAEEAPWYILRREHGWNAVAVAIIFLHFVIPFYALIVRAVKRNAQWLASTATLLLFAEWLYQFWLIIPPGRPHLGIHFADFLAFFGIGGIWMFFFLTRLRSRPLVPLGDPELQGAGK